jgi:hypothetical protein
MFVPVLVAPGHCLGWAMNLLGFRQRGAVQQLTWSVALSFAVAPIAAVMLGKYASIGAVCWAFVGCMLLTIAMNYWSIRQDTDRRFRWSRAAGMAIGMLWVLFVVFELVDFGVGNHLYLSVTVFDHSLRTAFVDGVMRTGVPPANPLYWPGHAAPMRYYYFWYVVTGVAARLAAVTARQAMIASVAWAGFGLAAIVSLYCRHFLAAETEIGGTRRRWSRVAIALALLIVTGLDILPALVKVAIRLPTDPDMEWWSSDQVTSWMDSIIWVPHHVAGLVCCLLGFLLVWSSKGLSARQRILCALVAGISFASAFGLSIWVPVAFVLVLSCWVLWVLRWEPESRPRVPVLLGAGLFAGLLLLPYLAELRAAPAAATATFSSGSVAGSVPALTVAGNARHLLHFGVRRIIDPAGVVALPWFADYARANPHAGPVAGVALQLLLLVPGYFTELGFYGMILAVVLLARRRMELDESTRTSLVLVIAALFVSTFLRSTIIENNDFGWRSILIAQFFLLLLAVDWCEGRFEPVGVRLRTAMIVMLWIGVAGTVYQAVGLRLYLPVEDRAGQPDSSGLAERAMAWQRGFDAMDRVIPRSAVIQFNTEQPSDYFRFAQVLEARRQIASAFPGCAAAFGGDPLACPGMEAGVRRLFSPATSGAALSAAEARLECGQLGVGYLIATRWDGVWGDAGGWVWTLPAAVDTGEVRVVDCGRRAK